MKHRHKKEIIIKILFGFERKKSQKIQPVTSLISLLVEVYLTRTVYPVTYVSVQILTRSSTCSYWRFRYDSVDHFY